MKKYRTLSRVLALFVVLAMLVACGPSAPAPAPAPPTPPPAGEDAQEVHIGLLAPLTGPVAYFGTSVYQGFQIFFDEYNARGGLQIRYTIFDEEGDASNAVVGYNSLVDQGVTAIIGSVTSTPTLAIVPLSYEDGMPMITATSTAAAVTVDAATGQVWSNMFRSCFIDPFQGIRIADFAVEELGATTAAVLFSNDIDYSIGLKEAFVARAAEIGLEIVHVEQFVDVAVDLSGQLTNIAAHNPDVVFFPAYIRHVALMAPQAQDVGLDAVILGADGWTGARAALEDPSVLERAYFLTGFSVESDDPFVQGFIASYTARWGLAPNMFAAQAYDAAMILMAAIELALADGYAPGTDEFKAATIRHMAATDITGVTGRITFDEFNNPQKTAFIVGIYEGEYNFWGTW